MTKCFIAPSMLSSDFAHLADESNTIIQTNGADWLHIDVMDGHFVQNLTLGAPIIKCLRKYTNSFMDCHLMVEKPQNYIGTFHTAGVNMFTFHLEATSDAVALIEAVHAAGMFCGVAIKPSSPVKLLWENKDIPSTADMILVMTVEPGFGGQEFMSSMLPKVVELRQRYPNLLIEVDGGLNQINVADAASAGANVIVAGSSIFGNPNRTQAVAQLKNACESCTSLPLIQHQAILEKTLYGKKI